MLSCHAIYWIYALQRGVIFTLSFCCQAGEVWHDEKQTAFW
jgi:hypothetical protein